MTNGLALLGGWLIFGGLLTVLVMFLHRPPDRHRSDRDAGRDAGRDG